MRLDLRGAKPPIWRRLILPGDIDLFELHLVIQTAMGWENGHLHKFLTGQDYGAASFVTDFDLEEGDDGVYEGEVRLDQVVAKPGDQLWYWYDFGDDWHHVLKVEEVLPEPPEDVVLVTGRRACPPEDCGGLWGYSDLAAWVESGYDDAMLPPNFESEEDALDWLPLDWTEPD